MGEVISLATRAHRLKPYLAIYWLQDVGSQFTAAVEARTTTDALRRLAVHPLMARHAPYIVKVELYQAAPRDVAEHPRDFGTAAVLDGKEFQAYM
ncbi:MAG TPA: hypothetical protein VLA24_05125 [Pseudomonadales bacterium]|nr:hypothetical protein [Pseudomonadales bacterium]